VEFFEPTFNGYMGAKDPYIFKRDRN